MTAHPAKFSAALMPVLEAAVPVDSYPVVVDPFAGTGRIHSLPNVTIGIEIEPEWASMNFYTICGDMFKVLPTLGPVDAIVTSCTYGNRMADHHEAKDGSYRVTYKHALGRALDANNSGSLQWGREYRDFHELAWKVSRDALRPGGRLVLNVKDHVRKGKQQRVSSWHARTILQLGFKMTERHRIGTPGMRQGENHLKRIPFEWVLVFDKSED